MHLRMTGTLLLDPPPRPPLRPRALRPRRRRTSCASATRGASGPASSRSGPRRRDAFFAARLGLEPLADELTGAALRALARGRRAPVKAFLLDQRGIAGVGNIYADEALFRAGSTRCARPAR